MLCITFVGIHFWGPLLITLAFALFSKLHCLFNTWILLCNKKKHEFSYSYEIMSICKTGRSNSPKILICHPLIIPNISKFQNFQNTNFNIYQLNFIFLPKFSLFLTYKNKIFCRYIKIFDTQFFVFFKIQAFIPKIKTLGIQYQNC